MQSTSTKTRKAVAPTKSFHQRTQEGPMMKSTTDIRKTEAPMM